jgi:hypothetical protein
MSTAAPPFPLLLCAVLALAAAAPAAAKGPAPAQPAAQPQDLPGVTVQGQHNPLNRSDRHLRQLKKSLPELGGKAAPTAADRASDYLRRHADPEAATGEQKRMMEKARQPEGPGAKP